MSPDDQTPEASTSVPKKKLIPKRYEHLRAERQLVSVGDRVSVLERRLRSIEKAERGETFKARAARPIGFALSVLSRKAGDLSKRVGRFEKRRVALSQKAA